MIARLFCPTQLSPNSMSFIFFLKRGIRKTEYGIRIIIRISSKTKVRTRTTISTTRHHQRTYKARATFLRTDSSRIITAIKLRCVRRKGEVSPQFSLPLHLS